MSSRVAVGLALLLVAGPTLAVVGSHPGGSATQPWAVATQQSFESTTFELTVYENGSTRWTLQQSRPLDNETEREQYRRFADEFTTGSHPVFERFKNTTRRLLATGREDTGRDMRATNFARRAYVSALGNRGVVEMSFTWRAFARVTDDRVVVGDVFEGGFYIGPDQWLVVRNGSGLRFASVDPMPDSMAGETVQTSDSLTWVGERVFTDNRPRVELVAVESTTASTTTFSTASTTTTTGTESGVVGIVMVGLLVLAIGLGGAALWRSGSLVDASTASDSGPTPQQVDGAGVAVQKTGAETETDQPDSLEDELLSDADRVIRMLESNDGRMKQVDIVDRTDWSKSKVSMLLSDMEEEGRISKLRVGRENIISLKGYEPDAAGSPFDDDE